MARDGYGGKASGDPGVAWRPIEAPKSTNKGKNDQGSVDNGTEDDHGERKVHRTRFGRVSLPLAPWPPSPPTPPPTPPAALPKTIAEASLLCGSRIVDVGLLQDFLSAMGY